MFDGTTLCYLLLKPVDGYPVEAGFIYFLQSATRGRLVSQCMIFYIVPKRAMTQRAPLAFPRFGLTFKPGVRDDVTVDDSRAYGCLWYFCRALAALFTFQEADTSASAELNAASSLLHLALRDAATVEELN